MSKLCKTNFADICNFPVVMCVVFKEILSFYCLIFLDFNRTTFQSNFLLFVQPKDPKKEVWDGSVVGTKAAVEFFEANEVSSIPLISV